MRMTIPAARINSTYANAAAITAISPNDRQDGDPSDQDVNYVLHPEAFLVRSGPLTSEKNLTYARACARVCA
jgi:hypothetical protein